MSNLFSAILKGCLNRTVYVEAHLTAFSIMTANKAEGTVGSVKLPPHVGYKSLKHLLPNTVANVHAVSHSTA